MDVARVDHAGWISQQQRVDQGEDGGVRAHAQGQRQHDRDRKAGTANEPAHRVPQVVVHPCSGTLSTMAPVISASSLKMATELTKPLNGRASLTRASAAASSARSP